MKKNTTAIAADAPCVVVNLGKTVTGLVHRNSEPTLLHTGMESAQKECTRLAEKYPGHYFGVFRLADTQLASVKVDSVALPDFKDFTVRED